MGRSVNAASRRPSTAPRRVARICRAFYRRRDDEPARRATDLETSLALELAEVRAQFLDRLIP